ncbi:MAG: DUF3990 domain-containing protein [Lachnospiraceae bacterium]|nr:DUF3990 domain-containing protein [Lachnospiraceae bacterium]
MKIYHGSKSVIEKPVFGGGKPNNDYGIGFYCTENPILANEWAVDLNRDGYTNCYELREEELRILNLNGPGYCILEWLAVLLQHREVELYYPLQREAKRYILENFFVDVNAYDVIRGYRADNSYFTFARDFLNGTISYRQLADAMRLGDLGEQIVLKSQSAFDAIEFLGYSTISAREWYMRKQQRDFSARRAYANMNTLEYMRNDLYIVQIINEEMRRDDTRLQ